MNVEVCNLSTVGNVLVSIVDHLRLNDGGEGAHLIVSTRMPGHAAHVAGARRGDGVVVNLSGGGEELHWCPLLMNILYCTGGVREPVL